MTRHYFASCSFYLATDSNDFVGTEISDLLAGDDPFQGMFEEVPKPEPQEPDVSLASLQSTFIEQYYDPAYHYQSQPGIRSDR